MARPGWLQISDYSNKYRVSVSTLRRRIKSEEIEYFFEDGKYWLPDASIDRYARKDAKPAMAVAAPTAPAPKAVKPEVPRTPKLETESDALGVAKEMIKEIKSAYVHILQEKEEQILLLKEELADLRTLCRILENDNERLKSEMTKASSVTSWLDDEPDSGVSI